MKSIFIIVFLLMAGKAAAEFSSDNIIIDIDLTSEEIQWLDNHKTIRISGPLNFPPFHFFNEDGIPMGIAADYVNILFNSLAIDADVQSSLSWPDVLRRVENKELDLIACSAKSADREEYLLFSEPHLSFPLVIISRNDSPFIGGIQDLSGLKVALIDKNIVTDWLKRDRIDVIPYSVTSPLEALESVSLGKADAFIGNLATDSFLIGENGLTNLKVAAPTEYGYYNLHIAIRNDWPELLSIINKGLGSFSPKQNSQIRSEWLSVKYEYGISAEDIIRSVLLVTVVAGIIVLIILRWNRILKKEIVMRKKIEEDLKAAFTDINTLEGLLPICASCKNIRDDKGYWKQIEGYFEEHSDLLFSHGLCPDCAEKLYGDKKWFKKENDK